MLTLPIPAEQIPALVQVLEQVRKELTPKHRWTQHALARTPQGLAIHERSALACQWCIVGKVNHVAYGNELQARGVISLLTDALNDPERTSARRYATIADYNDETDHECVMGLLDWTIAKHKGAPA